MFLFILKRFNDSSGAEQQTEVRLWKKIIRNSGKDIMSRYFFTIYLQVQIN